VSSILGVVDSFQQERDDGLGDPVGLLEPCPVTDTGQDLDPRAREHAALPRGLDGGNVDVGVTSHNKRVEVAVAKRADQLFHVRGLDAAVQPQHSPLGSRRCQMAGDSIEPHIGKARIIMAQNPSCNPVRGGSHYESPDYRRTPQPGHPMPAVIKQHTGVDQGHTGGAIGMARRPGQRERAAEVVGDYVNSFDTELVD
jgi:hypothetical protein